MSAPPSPGPATGDAKHGGQDIYHKAVNRIQRTQTIMRDTPLTVLGLNKKSSPKIVEIIEQSKILCEDYIFNRIEGSLLRGDITDGVGGKLTDVSREVQLIGAKLEATYPTLYSSVGPQVNMPMTSEIAVKRAVAIIGDYMFKHQVVNWARVVAMFAVAGGIAAECVQHNHPELIYAIVDVFSEVADKHFAVWVSKQGGWVELTKAYRLNQETRNLWALTGVGTVAGFVFTLITAMQI